MIVVGSENLFEQKLVSLLPKPLGPTALFRLKRIPCLHLSLTPYFLPSPMMNCLLFPSKILEMFFPHHGLSQIKKNTLHIWFSTWWQAQVYANLLRPEIISPEVDYFNDSKRFKNVGYAEFLGIFLRVSSNALIMTMGCQCFCVVHRLRVINEFPKESI